MYDSPSAEELLSAVQAFIATIAETQLNGHANFHARVAGNVLETVKRELSQRPEAEAGERQRLLGLLEVTDELGTPALNEELSRAIRDGQLEIDDPKLREHLKTTTIQQLLIDQPRYSGLDSD